MIAGDAADRCDLRPRPSSTRSTARCATRSTCAPSPAVGADELVPGVPRRVASGWASASARPSGRPRDRGSAGFLSVVDRGLYDRVDIVDGTARLDEASLGTEWEWERSPEVSLVIVGDVDRRGRTHQPVQPALRRVGDHRRPGRIRAVLRVTERTLRGRWLHPVGRRPVRPRSAGTRPRQLAGGSSARPGSDPVRRQRPYDPVRRVGHRRRRRTVESSAVVGQSHTPLTSTITCVRWDEVTQIEPLADSFRLAPFATGEASR